MRKPHRHVWSINGAQPVEIYDPYNGPKSKPVAAETEVLYRCLKCGKLKVKTIKGTWSREQLR